MWFTITATYEIHARDIEEAQQVWDDSGPEIEDTRTIVHVHTSEIRPVET